jgi:hypothetical protein
MGAFNLQARLRLVIYAAAMSSAEAAIALFAEQDIGQTPHTNDRTRDVQ